MDVGEVPAELKALLDEAAGKEHSADGGVMTALAAILTRHREMVLCEPPVNISCAPTPQEIAIANVVELVEGYSYIDGAHHKQWLIDQIMQTLLGDGYTEWVKAYETSTKDEWDKGIAP